MVADWNSMNEFSTRPADSGDGRTTTSIRNCMMLRAPPNSWKKWPWKCPGDSRHMLHYRMLGFSWDEIGGSMGLSAKQAKKRFYYGLKRGHEKVIRISTERFGRQEPE
jgi:hypothetical protein